MKKILSLALLLSLASTAFSQDTQVITEPSGLKIIKGFMTQKDLETDSAFAWYAQNRKGFTPNADAVAALRQQKDSINILVFGGTWCGDTRYLLPKFFAFTDAAGFAPERLTLIGVDRAKTTVHNLAPLFNVTRVPTVIIMKNGKEVGRVVEYGRMGAPDKEVGEMLKN